MANKSLHKQILIITIGLILIASGCKKRKAQKGWIGNWVVNTEMTARAEANNHPLVRINCNDVIKFSGSMRIDEDGEGTIKIFGDYCGSIHTMFDTTITEFDVIDHSGSRDFGNGIRSHWYQLYFNDNIYCDFESTIEGDKVNKLTKNIQFNINSLINQDEGSSIERFDLKLVMTRIP